MSPHPAWSPRAPLNDFIRLLWHQLPRLCNWTQESLMPMGTVEIVFPLTSDAEPILCGPHDRPFILHNPGAQEVLGIHFRPGGIRPFIPFPASELKNQVLNLSDIWGSRAYGIRDGLREIGDLPTRYRLLENVLQTQAIGSLRRSPTLARSLKILGARQVRVMEAAECLGYSRRHFHNLLTIETGLAPKNIARVFRFQTTLTSLESSPTPDLGELAIDCGFYDQSHLANDFRQSSGMSIGRYLESRTPHLNHVPIAD